MAQRSTDVALRALCLFDGYGGFELGLRSVARVRTVARVERDAHAAAVLVARMEEARLDQAPIWDDVFTFDGSAWRGKIDVVTAGFPCQPWSAAGNQRGTDDARWLWPEVARIVGEVGPSYVFLENVPGLNAARWDRAGLQYVLQDLADLGSDAEWGLLSASAIGAPHKRERFWLVANANGGRRVRGFTRDPGEWPAEGSLTSPERCDADVGHASGAGRPEVPRGTPGDEGPDGRQPDCGHIVDGASEDVADPTSVGWHEGIRPATRHRRSEPQAGSRAWPPGPDDHTGWVDYIAAGGPQPVVRRSTDGPPLGLADALHLGGNGLVPQCAAEAWTQLRERLTYSLN